MRDLMLVFDNQSTGFTDANLIDKLDEGFLRTGFEVTAKGMF